MKQEFEMESVNAKNANRNLDPNAPRITNSEIAAQFQRARQTMHNIA